MVSVSIIGLVIYWLVYPYNPVDINSVTLQSKTVKAGGTLFYTVDRCRNTDAVVEVTRFLVDGVKISYPVTSAQANKGCEVNTYPISIPDYTPAGIYHFEFTYKFQVNPLRIVQITVQTEQFNIE